MALATQCPHCHTTFRVAHDQLKLRAGLVRCGACKQIFNGIENLLRPEEAERALPPPASAPAPVPAEPPPAPADAPPQADHSAEQPQTEPHESVAAEEAAPAPEPVAAQDEAVQEQPAADQFAGMDPLQRMTLLDFSPAEPARAEAKNEDAAQAHFRIADELDALEKAIDDLQHQPWRAPAAEKEAAPAASDELDQADDSAYEEPAFVKQGRRRQRMQRLMRILMALALPLLLAGFLAQGIYLFRNQLAAWFPEAKPALATACRLIDCEVGLPTQIDAVAIESSELQAADQNTFSLSVLLANHGAIMQAWPNIELTLNDADDKPIARRVFVPRDYLPASQEIDKGFAPKSEQAIKLYFELTQLKASGYRVYLFYP